MSDFKKGDLVRFGKIRWDDKISGDLGVVIDPQYGSIAHTPKVLVHHIKTAKEILVYASDVVFVT